MLAVYRYILFIVLPMVVDLIYYRIVAPAYTSRHLVNLYRKSDGRVDNYYIRIFAISAIYIIYGVAFAYVTTDPDNVILIFL